MAARYRYGNNEETEPLYDSAEMQTPQMKNWNVFKEIPREPTVGSTVETKFLDASVKFLKVFTMVIVFTMVLGTAVISKATTLFMTSQIAPNVTRPYCNKNLDINGQFIVTLPTEERITWIWFLMFAYFVPEFGTFFRAVRKCLFKTWTMPGLRPMAALCVTEGAPAIGSALLIFVVLPEMDVIKGAMLTNAVCFVPGIIAMFSRNPCRDNFKMALDIVSIVAQVSSFVVWPLLEEKPILYMIPVSVILISLGWWENYVSKHSRLPFIRALGEARKEFDLGNYFAYAVVAPLKCLLFFCTVLVIYWTREGGVAFLFDNFSVAFEDHWINVTEIQPILFGGATTFSDAITIGSGSRHLAHYMTPIWVWLINILSTYLCYAFGKFACKVMVQEVGFAFPVNLTVPILLSGLIAMCGVFTRDDCSFSSVIPPYLFFNTPPLYFLNDFVAHQHAWIWLVWLLSQAWITVHIWSPNCDKLASTEQLFLRPMYDAFLVDQSLALNRRRFESPRHKQAVPQDYQDVLLEDDDEVTRIYACGTMWHETEDEMLAFLKSIFRLDADQNARELIRNKMKMHIESYYTLETHVFFDDAFVRVDQNDDDPQVNEYVHSLVNVIDKAASQVHATNVTIGAPKIYPTPYGGKLIWTLPGGTKMITHLKDKKKIRPKKRWSQVMYMYYLLGHRLASNDDLTKSSKELRYKNTYILALDGDIDFQPEALHLLVDYMKKNSGLGAACGRIHPVGSGGLAWYQMFEYAVGHWLQKATEHVIGCVLCSPGCFSLFRGKALADVNVMKKYTTRPSEAKHYVQYDQGEDRWLCTLLLQRGWRVEYSAASDAYTHCPEGFKEFYNQRRRWMPSTMANSMDLILDYEETVKLNDNISMLYIFYQVILMIGTVIGPGTIFLMLVGAFVAAFGLDQWNSLWWNLAPILIFVIVCATCSADIQIFFAGVISGIYGLIMMAVFVGVMLQISEDGILAPSSLFFFCMAGEFIIAALLHPKEFGCLKYGVVYYVTVPSMYMLLVIYSVFNMNNVSWGTREVTVVAKKDPSVIEEEKNENKKEEKKDKILTFLGADADDNEGALEFSLNKLFKCMFCTYKGDNKEDEKLRLIQEAIKELGRKLDRLEDETEKIEEKTGETTILEGSKGTLLHVNNEDESTFDDLSLASDSVVENSWLYSGQLVKSEVHYLEGREEDFWKELLEEYLYPVEDDKEKVSADLKDLRDRMVLTFFMLNSLFVLVVFLMTLEKETLHINWPFNAKVNFTYVNSNNEFLVSKTYLRLEPIGFVFLIFFALLLVVQFIAMLIHRFATFSQIISNTHLEFSLFSSDVTDMTDDEIKNRDPLKIAKDLQRLKGINDEMEDAPDEPVQHRMTMNNLRVEGLGRSSVKPIFDLTTAYNKRVEESLDDPNASELRKKSVAFVKQRTKDFERRKSALPRSSAVPRASAMRSSVMPRPSVLVNNMNLFNESEDTEMDV